MSGFDGLSNHARLRSGLGGVWAMGGGMLNTADGGEVL